MMVKLMYNYGHRELFKENFKELHLMFYQLDRLLEVHTCTCINTCTCICTCINTCACIVIDEIMKIWSMTYLSNYFDNIQYCMPS